MNPIIDTIERFGLNAKKSLGQHFLLDQNITDKVARAAGNLTQHTVIEIGPGPGGLTRSLLAAGAREVVAVEKDARCIAALAELAEAYPGRLRVIEADAEEVDIPSLTQAPRKIVANLPYNIGTPLLVKWLSEVGGQGSGVREPSPLPDPRPPTSGPYTSLTLMFQREVAERICAERGGKEYGRLSVFAQWLCEVTHHFDLPPGAFSPPPKVYSSVITLVPRPSPIAAPKDALERVLAAGFGQRRKMLRQSLKGLSVPPETLLEIAGIDGTRRAETLSLEEWCRLARTLAG